LSSNRPFLTQYKSSGCTCTTDRRQSPLLSRASSWIRRRLSVVNALEIGPSKSTPPLFTRRAFNLMLCFETSRPHPQQHVRLPMPPTSPQPTSLDGTCALAHILTRARPSASSGDERRRERRRRWRRENRPFFVSNFGRAPQVRRFSPSESPILSHDSPFGEKNASHGNWSRQSPNFRRIQGLR